MFSKEQAKELKLEFWKKFGEYCRVHPELADRKKIFILHDTGINHVDLKFDVDRSYVRVVLEVNHKNQDRRLDVYEYVEAFKGILQEDLENLNWDFAFIRDNGQEVGRAWVELLNMDFHKKENWAAIFGFMADNMYILERNFLEIKETLKEQLHNI